MLFKFKQHNFKLLVEFNSLIATIQKMKLFTFFCFIIDSIIWYFFRNWIN